MRINVNIQTTTKQKTQTNTNNINDQIGQRINHKVKLNINYESGSNIMR